MVQLDPNMSNPFEIVIGTYEQYVLGYKVDNIVNEYTAEKTFATHSHLGSVRTVAGCKHYLASGGADDSVYLYDMRHRLESGRLMHHNDTVNCVTFTPQASHLFTCSNDGSIAAIRCGSWQIEKHWQKAHKGLAVNAIAIHPTGKIALSTGADGILRTWNLVKGRQAYATNLVPRLKLDAKNVNVLKWSPNGEKYLLAVNQRIDVYSVELAGIDDEIKFDSKIICVEFLRDDLIAVGLENGQVKFYDLEKSVQTVQAIAHDIRVKCIAFKDDLLVTASSSGEIKLWRYTSDKLDMLHSVNCGARITCLSLIKSWSNSTSKNGIKVEEEEEQKKEVKEKKKFGFRQEVIVENEGDWDVTLIESSKQKKKGKRNLEETNDPIKKKSRAHLIENSKIKKKREWSVEDISLSDDIPKKKKKKKLLDGETETNVVHKKRKKNSELLLETNDTPPKKVKKSTEKNTKNVIISNEKEEKDLSGVQEISEISLHEKRKEIMSEAGGNLKKKKKKYARCLERSSQLT